MVRGLQHICFQDKSIILNRGQDRLGRPHSSLMCMCTLCVLPRTKDGFATFLLKKNIILNSGQDRLCRPH